MEEVGIVFREGWGRWVLREGGMEVVGNQGGRDGGGGYCIQGGMEVVGFKDQGKNGGGCRMGG